MYSDYVNITTNSPNHYSKYEILNLMNKNYEPTIDI